MGLKNMIHNHFYGNPNTPEYTEADLPKNRIELFMAVLDSNKGQMVGLNLMYFASWLPAVLWTTLNVFHLYTCINENTLTMQVFTSVWFTWVLFMFPLIFITGPFNMGATYVLRNFARDEHSFVAADFVKAIKQNWRQGFLFSFFDGLMLLSVSLWVIIVSNLGLSSGQSYLIIGIVAAVALLWSLIIQILPMMIVTYEQGFFAKLGNAALLTIAALPRSIAIKLLTLIVPAFISLLSMLFPQAFTWVFPITLSLYVFFLVSFNKLIQISFANAVCEKYLNPRIDGAKTNIGLHVR